MPCCPKGDFNKHILILICQCFFQFAYGIKKSLSDLFSTLVFMLDGVCKIWILGYYPSYCMPEVLARHPLRRAGTPDRRPGGGSRGVSAWGGLPGEGGTPSRLEPSPREGAVAPLGSRPACGRGRPGASPKCQLCRKRERFLVESGLSGMALLPGGE